MIYVLSNFTYAYFQQLIVYHHLTESHRKFSNDNNCPVYIPQKYYLNTSYIFFHNVILQSAVHHVSTLHKVVYGCVCLTIVHILSVSTVYWKLQSMAMEWPSVAKCHVVKILELGPYTCTNSTVIS